MQCLTFSCGPELFAVPMLDVQEIVIAQPTYRMAGAPEHMERFFSLRNEPVMLLNLAHALNLADYEPRAFVVLMHGPYRLALPASNVHEAVDVDLLEESIPSGVVWLKWAKLQDNAIALIDTPALFQAQLAKR